MTLLAVIFFSLLALALLGWVIFLAFFTREIIKDWMRGEAPFIPAKPEQLAGIAKAVDLQENSVLYDLGSGDARVLVACHKLQPKARCIGYEKNFLPYHWSKFRLRMMGLVKNVRIHKKDFLAADLAGATHIFLYLIPRQLEKLEAKLARELKKGTKVFSLRFGLENRIPHETIPLGKENLYIYEF